jgi:hypothetical protein
VVFMPKRIYTIARARAEKKRDDRKHGFATNFFGETSWEQRAPVFKFLEEQLGIKPVGARATFVTKRPNGRTVDYVYQKGPKHYFLVGRVIHLADGATQEQTFQAPKRSSEINRLRMSRGGGAKK